MKQNRTLSLISVILAIMIWAASFISTRIAVTAFSPLMIGFLRFLFAFLLMGVIVLLRRKPLHIAPGDRRRIAFTAVFGITVYYALENYGIALTSASNASLITAVYPIFTVVIGRIVFHDSISLRQYAGIFIAVAGILFLTASPLASGGSDVMLGNLLMIANGVNWGFYNYLIQSVSEETDITSMTFMQAGIAAVCFLPLLAFDLPIEIGPLTPAVIVSMVFLSAGCSVAAFYLYNGGLRGISAALAAAALNLMPVFGLFFSWSILHEPITMREIIGAAIVIFGVVLSSR